MKWLYALAGSMFLTAGAHAALALSVTGPKVGGTDSYQSSFNAPDAGKDVLEAHVFYSGVLSPTAEFFRSPTDGLGDRVDATGTFRAVVLFSATGLLVADQQLEGADGASCTIAAGEQSCLGTFTFDQSVNGDLVLTGGDLLNFLLDLNYTCTLNVSSDAEGTTAGDCSAGVRYVYDTATNGGGGDLPEPGTMALMGLALAGLGFGTRRRVAA